MPLPLWIPGREGHGRLGLRCGWQCVAMKDPARCHERPADTSESRDARSHSGPETLSWSINFERSDTLLRSL